MKVGFIGSGKVGISFGIFLYDKKITISGYYSRHLESASQAAQRFNSTAFKTLDALIAHSDIIGITVNDDQIDHVVEAIEALKVDVSHKIFFHMSGVHDCLTLKKLSIDSFSLHPLKAFPQVVESSRAFDAVVFSLEGATQANRKWIDSLEIDFFEIQSNQKALYHAAAVIVSNYLVAVVDFGLRQFAEMGIEKSMAMKALWPLISGTLANVETLGTEKALTGPIVRGDIKTLEKHLLALDADSKMLYQALGKYTLSMTHQEEALQQKISNLF